MGFDVFFDERPGQCRGRETQGPSDARDGCQKIGRNIYFDLLVFERIHAIPNLFGILRHSDL